MTADKPCLQPLICLNLDRDAWSNACVTNQEAALTCCGLGDAANGDTGRTRSRAIEELREEIRDWDGNMGDNDKREEDDELGGEDGEDATDELRRLIKSPR